MTMTETDPLWTPDPQYPDDLPPPAPGSRLDDADAPYGFTVDGNVRDKPGRKPGQPNGTGRAAQKAAAGTKKAAPTPPPKKATAPKQAPPAKKTAVDYRPGIMNLLGQGIGTAAILGLVRGRHDIMADAAAVDQGAPALAELANQAAEQWTFVAAILDKLLKIGPFAASGGGVLIMLAQLAVNHRVMPPGIVPGTVAPERLISNFIDKQLAESDEFRAVMEFMTSQAPPPAA